MERRWTALAGRSSGSWTTCGRWCRRACCGPTRPSGGPVMHGCVEPPWGRSLRRPTWRDRKPRNYEKQERWSYEDCNKVFLNHQCLSSLLYNLGQVQDCQGHVLREWLLEAWCHTGNWYFENYINFTNERVSAQFTALFPKQPLKTLLRASISELTSL